MLMILQKSILCNAHWMSLHSSQNCSFITKLIFRLPNKCQRSLDAVEMTRLFFVQDLFSSHSFSF